MHKETVSRTWALVLRSVIGEWVRPQAGFTRLAIRRYCNVGWAMHVALE